MLVQPWFDEEEGQPCWKKACVSVARGTKLSFDHELCCPVPEKLNLEESLS